MRECQQRAISVTRTATILPVSGLPYSSRHEGVKTAPETAADGDGPVLVGDGPSGNRALPLWTVPKVIDSSFEERWQAERYRGAGVEFTHT